MDRVARQGGVVADDGSAGSWLHVAQSADAPPDGSDVGDTLWVELLTVAVIEAPAFDRLFADMVGVNEEGSAVSTEAGRPAAGILFTSEAREHLQREPLSPIARACVEQAWQHRHTLLAR